MISALFHAAGHLLKLRDPAGKEFSRARMIEEFKIFFIAGSETTGAPASCDLGIMSRHCNSACDIAPHCLYVQQLPLARSSAGWPENASLADVWPHVACTPLVNSSLSAQGI